jgi:hypothetical protein
MSEKKDNFVIYANVIIHLCLTLLLPLVFLLLVLTMNYIGTIIGIAGLVALILKASFDITKGGIVISEKET